MICLPLKKKTVAAYVRNIKDSQGGIDVLELWLDELKDFGIQSLERIFKSTRKPVIYKSYSNLKNIESISRFKPSYIDLDIKTSISKIKKIKKLLPRTQIIISFHDFNKTPKNLDKIAKKALHKSADIIKIATHANSINDSFGMMAFLSEISNRHKAICLCMGKKGAITRRSGHLFGNYLMYAFQKPGQKTAPGQINVKELKEIQTITKKLCL